MALLLMPAGLHAGAMLLMLLPPYAF